MKKLFLLFTLILSLGIVGCSSKESKIKDISDSYMSKGDVFAVSNDITF